MKTRFGRRALAAIMAASMVLSASSQVVSAKDAVSGSSNATSEVSDTSSAAVTSAAQSNAPSTVVAETAALTVVQQPSGLRGQGTQASPYQVGSLDDFLLMNYYINYEQSGNKYFILTADIDMSGLSFPALSSPQFEKESDFRNTEGIYSVVSATPSLSGNSNVFFRLDGDGHILYNLNVNVPQGVQAAALFGYIGANSSIENLTVSDSTVTVSHKGDGAYALLAVQNIGAIRNVTINDCKIDYRPAKPGDLNDGFVKLDCGKICKGVSLVIADNNGSLSGITVQASDRDHGVFVRGAVKYVGVIAAQNRKTISDCTVSGARVLAFGSDAPAGVLSGEGKVASYIGVIAGSNDSYYKNTPASISACSVQLSSGSVMFGNIVGGIVGLNNGTVAESTVSGASSATAAPSSADAEMTGSGCFGGIAGENKGTLSGCGAYDVGFAFSASGTNQEIYGGVVGTNHGQISASVSSGYVHVGSHAAAYVGGVAGSVSTGSRMSDVYAFVAVSEQTVASGSIAGGNASASVTDKGCFWIRTAYGFDSAVPGSGVTTGSLQTESTVFNIPVGDKGITFNNYTLHNTWSRSTAKVAVNYRANITVDNPSIHVNQTSSSFRLSSDTAGAQGYVTYSATVTLPNGVGTRKTMDVRVAMPVFVTAMADAGAGSSVSNPILISDYTQFRYIASAPDAHYRLDSDITVAQDWIPVDFTGTLNGAGHTLTVSGGLFTSVSGSRNGDLNATEWKNSDANRSAGLICDLTIKAAGTVNGSLFGTLNNATLDRVAYAAANDSGCVVLSAETAGALADNAVGNVYLHNCYVSVPITVTSAASAGIAALVGNVSAGAFLMDNCGSSSAIAMDGNNLIKVGGLIGCIDALERGQISNCYASGSVYTKPAVENVRAKVMIGAVAAAAKKNLTLDNCYYSYAADAVSGGSVATIAVPFRSDAVMSLADQSEEVMLDCDGEQETRVTFALPENLDAVRDTTAEDIIIVLESDAVEVTTDATVSGTDVSVGVTAAGEDDEIEDAELIMIHEPTGLQITDVFLPAPSDHLDETTFTYNGVSETYYIISSYADIAYVQNNWSIYKSANLLLSGSVSGSGSGSMTPLGSSSAPFTGKLIGATSSASISGLSITDNGEEGCGLFAYSNGAVFSGFTLSGINVESDYAGTAVLVGRADYQTSGVTKFENITISNCSVTCNAEGDEPIDTSAYTDAASGAGSGTSATNGSNYPSDTTLQRSAELNEEVDTKTVQVGSLAGSLGTTNTSTPYSITGIIVHDTTVTDEEDYAFGVGGLIGYAYCNSDAANPHYLNSDYSTTTIGSATNVNYTTGGDTVSASVILYNVGVTGYGSVGGVLGMAGHFPQNANSKVRYQNNFATNSNNNRKAVNIILSTHLGALDIQNVLVAGDSTSDSYVHAGIPNDNLGGPSGGILGSEVAGYYHRDFEASVSISDAEVRNTSVRSYALTSDENAYDPACGGIAGYCGGSVSDCTVSGCEVQSVSAGGIVGRASRKAYKFTDGNSITLTGCNVVGSAAHPTLISNIGTTVSGTTISVSASNTALSLGGIAAAEINAGMSITSCGVGQNVYIGGARYAGGFIGFVYSYDPAVMMTSANGGGVDDVPSSVNKPLLVWNTLVTQSVCAATIRLTGVSSSAVGGAIGYASVVPVSLVLTYNALDGSYTNTNGYCAGVIGSYVDAAPAQGTTTNTRVYDPAETSGINDMIVSNAIAAQLNPDVSPAPSNYQTCWLIAGLNNAYWFPLDNLAAVCHDNILSSFGQAHEWKILGKMYDDASGTYEIIETDYPNTNTISGTYIDVDMTNGMYADSSDGTTAHPYLKITGPSVTTGTTVMNNLPTAYTTDGRLSDPIVWSTSDSSIITVSNVGTSNGNPSITVTAHSSGTTASIVGALSVINPALTTPAAFVYPGTSDPVKMRIHVPVLVEGVAGAVTWTTRQIENETFYEIPDFLHLDAMHNRSDAEMAYNYVVTGDINVAASSNQFVPIAGSSGSTAFSGKFYCAEKSGGGYYTISNLSYTDASLETKATNAGLFATASGATFKNVSLSGISISASGSGSAAGALVGSATNSCKFFNILIVNPTVSAVAYAGGIAGVASGSNTKATDLTVTYSSSNHANATGDGGVAAGAFAKFEGAIGQNSPTADTSTITNPIVSGSIAAGAIGVVSAYTTVLHVNVLGGTVAGGSSGGSASAGGIVGSHIANANNNNTVDTLSVTDCKSTANVSCVNCVGGVVGYTAGLSALSVSGSNVGGTLTGTSTGNADHVGGVLGKADGISANARISNTVFYGTLTASGERGGAIGMCDANQSANPVANFYYSSYQTGSVYNMIGSHSSLTGTYYNLHDEFGYKMTPTSNSGIDCIRVNQYTLDDSLFTYGTMTKSSGTYASFVLLSGVSFVLSNITPNAEHSTMFTYSAGTFTVGTDEEGYAEFRFTNGIVTDIPFRVSAVEGTGSSDDPYVIRTTSQLPYLYDSNKSSSCFALGANLDLSTWSWDTTTGWASTAWAGTSGFTGTLSGTYEGTQYKLQNFTFDDSNEADPTKDYVGFFPEFNGTLKDITFSGCTVVASKTGSNAGIAVGKLGSSGKLSGVTVENSSVSADRHAGALVGVSLGTVTGTLSGTGVDQTYLHNIIRNTTVSAGHCAGGAVGGGAHVSYVDVLGCTVHADQYVGGVVGGTFSFTDEIFTPAQNESAPNWIANVAARTSISSSSAHGNIDNCTVSSAEVNNATVNSSIYSNEVTTQSCVGGILGCAEAGMNQLGRYVDIASCKIEAGTSITADYKSSDNATQYNFAGGILGYIDNYHTGLVIDNCEMYGTVEAHGKTSGAVNYTAAGGLFGSTYVNVSDGSYGSLRFHADGESGTPLTIHFNRNVINGSITSSAYAGGIAGRFVVNQTPSSPVNFRIRKNDQFMCYNIVAPTFVNSSGSELFGVWMGEFLVSDQGLEFIFDNDAEDSESLPGGVVMDSAVRENYYSSYVTNAGANSGMGICSAGSFIGVDADINGLYDVASYTYTDANSQTVTETSLTVKNSGDEDYTSSLNGKLAAGSYDIPINFIFNGYQGEKDLSIGDPAATFTIGVSASGYATRRLGLSSTSFSLLNAGSYYSAIYYTVSDSGTHHGIRFTIASNASQCTTQPYLEADIGCGLKVGIVVTSSKGSGIPADPYVINSEAMFVQYFISSPVQDYQTKYYIQTVDLNFDTILSNIPAGKSFAPIGTTAVPFTGGYQCGTTLNDAEGKRIYNFTYSNAALDAVGLFGCVDDPATTSYSLDSNKPRLEGIHIELKDPGVSGGMYTGGLVGLYNSAYSIKNCSVVYSTVKGSKNNGAFSYVNVGGLVGQCGSITLDGCFTSTDVRCGMGPSTSAQDYYYTGDSVYSSYSSGGLVGTSKETNPSATVTFSRCFSSSDVISAFNVGGFVGRLINQAVSIEDGISTASVTSLYHLRQQTDELTYSMSIYPISLISGYRYFMSGSTPQLYTSGNYVTAKRLIAAGMNTSEYARNYYSGSQFTYPTLFGLRSATTGDGGSSDVYYDMRVIGRMSVPTNTADVYYVQRADGSLHAMSNSDAVVTDNSVFVPTGMTTADLLQLSMSGSAWSSTQDTSLYPILNMYDAYSIAYAKMSSLPAFVDPREADDGDAGTRSYKGLTYPVSIDDKIGGQPITIGASTFSMTNDGTYKDTYDLEVYGGFSGSNYSPVTSKSYDLLFKHPYTQFKVLRNSYLHFGSGFTGVTEFYENVLRDEKSPYVRVSAIIDNQTVSRLIRIPLRGEANTVYVSTERQLRAIMGTQTGAGQTETAQRFIDAYRNVIGSTTTGPGNVLVCADIDLNRTVDFKPITGYVYKSRDSKDYLKCGFDGGNCVISGMVINSDHAATDEVGMFSSIVGSDVGVKLRNIILQDVDVYGRNYVGALVGKCGNDTSDTDNILIVNCRVTSSNKTIVVDNTDPEHPVTQTLSSQVSGATYVGGLIGFGQGVSINYAFTNSTLHKFGSDLTTYPDEYSVTSGSDARVYGTGGQGEGTGSVICVGGLIGKMDGVKVYNCYATGDVEFTLAANQNIHGLTSTYTDNSVGGFVGTVVKPAQSDIDHAFAFGNVRADATTSSGVYLGSSTYTSAFGVGGFVGCTAIPLSDCFASGDVSCIVGSTGYNTAMGATINENTNPYFMEHGVGGVVGLAMGDTASVTNVYSSSAVSFSCAAASIGIGAKIGVGGVVGYSDSASSSVSYVYSSGSVAAPYEKMTNGVNNHYFGGAVGYSAGTATHAYFDQWTNTFWYGSGVTLKAVGNYLDDDFQMSGGEYVLDANNEKIPTTVSGRLRSGFTTDEFCSGALVTGNNLPAPAWGYDYQEGVTSNAYPYLTSFFGADVSDYVKYPAVLSIVAVRPNDRDENGRKGLPLSMAVTMPTDIHVEGTTYTLGHDSGANYGHTFAPVRSANDEDSVSFRFWIQSYQNDGESAVYDGYYDLSDSSVTGAIAVTAANYAMIKAQAKDTFVPHIGQYVLLSDGFKGYGIRSIERIYQRMLGTDKFPYLISTIEELKHVASFTNGYDIRNVSDSTYYDCWFSQQQKINGSFINVSRNSNTDENGAQDSIVHFKLMINIDMKNTSQIAALLHSMHGYTFTNQNGDTITFNGFDLDGNDYAIVNLTSDHPLIDTLDQESTVRNLIVDNANISGSGNDLALVGTNNGVIDGLLLMQSGDALPGNESMEINAQDTGNNHAAGLVVTNNGTIRNSFAQGTIYGGGTDKYVGAIAAVNNGTIERCAAAAEIEANDNTAGIGGLVGYNAANHSITDCFTLGSVDGTATGSAKTGGLVGVNAGTVSYSYSRAVVSGKSGHAGSYVGSNSGTITDGFSAGTMTLSSSGSGSLFAGANTGTLTDSFADKALLGSSSNSASLLLDGEVTENIRSLDCFSDEDGDDHYLMSGGTGSKTETIDGQSVTTTWRNRTVNAYPQLNSIYRLYVDNTSTYEIGEETRAYTMMKAQLLKAYSILSSVTVDSVAANFVDSLPLGTSNVVTTIQAPANASTPTTEESYFAAFTITPASPLTSAVAASGNVTAVSIQVSQKTGAGDNTADDLKYTPEFIFPYAFTAAGNTNFTSGKGIDSAPYGISTKLGLESLTYYGKATDAYFTLTDDVSLGGQALSYPIEKFYAHLDGDGYTINDLDITNRSGLIEKIMDGAEISNLGLVGVELTTDNTITSTTRNFGLLAGEAGAATIENVYAVGKMQIGNVVAGTGDVRVGGLIGYAKGTELSGIVTSGDLRSTVSDSVVGGVIGAMQGGSLAQATSTAYVSGVKYAGGIVGDALDIPAVEEGDSATPAEIDYVVYAGAVDETATAYSHILAHNGGTCAITKANAWYDKQISSFDESEDYTKRATFALAKYDQNGFTPLESGKYYSSPIGSTVITGASDAFKAGLYFALARITISLAGGEGDLNSYDKIKVSSPMTRTVSGVSTGNTYDLVTLAVDANSNKVTITNDDGTKQQSILEPNGDGTNLSAGLKASLSRGTDATFEDNVNELYRYLPIKIGRLVDVFYTVTDSTTGASFGNTDLVLMIQSRASTVPISANAITNASVDDPDGTGTVRYGRIFVPGGSGLQVDAVLPAANACSVKTSSGALGNDRGNTSIPASAITYNSATGHYEVHVYAHVHEANPTWGLQHRNSVVTH